MESLAKSSLEIFQAKAPQQAGAKTQPTQVEGCPDVSCRYHTFSTSEHEDIVKIDSSSLFFGRF